jgi:hypothetical protein
MRRPDIEKLEEQVGHIESFYVAGLSKDIFQQMCAYIRYLEVRQNVRGLDSVAMDLLREHRVHLRFTSFEGHDVQMPDPAAAVIEAYGKK